MYQVLFISMTHKPSRNAEDLYPTSIASPHLRQAMIIRGQLCCQVYLTQDRLCKLRKETSDTCRLCSKEKEDTTHFVGACPALAHQRNLLHSIVAANSHLSSLADSFDPVTPDVFTRAVLLLPESNLSTEDRNLLNTHILNFLFKLHTTRLNLFSPNTTT